jgi:hypothetical protein
MGVLETDSVSETGCEMSRAAMLEWSFKCRGWRYLIERPRRKQRLRHARSPSALPTPCPSAPQATKARGPANGVPRRRASVRASSWYLGYRSLWYLAVHCIHWIRARLQLESTSNSRRVHVVDPPQSVDKQYMKGLRNTSGESRVLCRPFEAQIRQEQYDLCINRP